MKKMFIWPELSIFTYFLYMFIFILYYHVMTLGKLFTYVSVTKQYNLPGRKWDLCLESPAGWLPMNWDQQYQLQPQCLFWVLDYFLYIFL